MLVAYIIGVCWVLIGGSSPLISTTGASVWLKPNTFSFIKQVAKIYFGNEVLEKKNSLLANWQLFETRTLTKLCRPPHLYAI